MGSCGSNMHQQSPRVRDVPTDHTAPPFGFRGNVKDVEPICEAGKEAFKRRYTSNEYKGRRSVFAKSIAKPRKVREIQYNRWRWSQSHMETYINELRVSGFSDTQIQDMLSGCPLCFVSPAEYEAFSAACSQLCRHLESAPGNVFHNIRVAVTGSSVTGFSQNPLEGITGQPSKIISPTELDVNICFVVGGFTDWIKSLKLSPQQYHLIPTTCGPHTSTARVGLRDNVFAQILPKELTEFYKLWDRQLLGDLHITFQDSGTDLPPWEVYMPLGAESSILKNYK